MLFEKQDERLGCHQPSHLLTQAGFAADAGTVGVPLAVAVTTATLNISRRIDCACSFASSIEEDVRPRSPLYAQLRIAAPLSRRSIKISCYAPKTLCLDRCTNGDSLTATATQETRGQREKRRGMPMYTIVVFDEADARHNIGLSREPHGRELDAMHDLQTCV
jgi:hypothetical protein